MENTEIIILRVLIMSMILAVGAIGYKSGVITKDGTRQLSAVALKIINPVLIFMSYQQEYNSKLFFGLLWTFLLSAVSFGVMILLAMFLKRKKDENLSVERFSCIYSNCGFMGIPLIRGLFGDEGVLYLTAYITVFNLLAFTHGYMMMKEEHDLSALKKALNSPTVISVIIGAICYVTGLRVASIPNLGGTLTEALKLISDMNTPMAMLIAGSTAAQNKLIRAFKDPGILTTTAYKLLLIPGIITGLMFFVPLSVPLMPRMIVCIACACPAATTGTMFALLFNKNARRCSEIFAVTTLLSMITLPMITALASKILH